MEKLPTILVVEDDSPTRQRLCKIISEHPSLHLAGYAANFFDGLEKLCEIRPTVLLTDLGLPDGNGLDLIHAIQQYELETESMVITVFGDERHVLKAIEAGATGYLLKDSDGESIAESILQLLAGGSPISPAIARHVLRRVTAEATQDNNEPETLLTARELEVLSLLGKGLSYTEVADTLQMSSGTVTTHVKHIYRKLAVRSRGEAVFEALQRGLLKIDRP